MRERCCDSLEVMWQLPVKLSCTIVLCTGLLFAQTKQLTEAEALSAITLATNPTTKLAAAEEFVNKFPKSDSRLKAAELVAAEILKVQNGAVAITLVERAQSIFTAAEERELFKRTKLSAYVLADRPKEAFKSAAEILARHPNDLETLMMIVDMGAAQARKRKLGHAEVAMQYALTAIAMIETGEKPANVDQQAWAENTSKVASLYQHTAILYLGANKPDEAKVFLKKAIDREPRDPSNYALFGRVIHAEYEKLRDLYEGMPEGKPQQELLKKINELVDQMIDAYARTAALAAGRPEYQLLMQQVVPDLTSYYMYRNNQSTKGLQQLIDKYKRQP